MRSTYFKLVDKEVVPTTDVEEAFGKKVNRRVAFTKVRDVDVSTIFLGIDHGYGEEKRKPLIFETLVFGGDMDGVMERYYTYKEAVIGHAIICERVVKSQKYPLWKVLKISLQNIWYQTKESIKNIYKVANNIFWE